MIYLYVKTHNKTGLKYLGKTTKDDPFKYTGSGTLWIKHIKKHGYDVNTEILLATDNLEEFIETALFFSKLWNIVNSKEWANLMEEKGDGIDSDTARKIAQKRIDNKTHPFLKGNRSKNISNSNKRGMTYEQIYGEDAADKLKKQRSKTNSERWLNEEFKKRVSSKISQTRKEKFENGQIVPHNKGKKSPSKEVQIKRERIRNDFIISGLSRKEYAEKHSINYTTLKGYLKGL